MLVFVRFTSDPPVEQSVIEEAVQGCVGRSGAVVGASAQAVDVEVGDEAELRPILSALAAALRDLGMPPSTELDIPSAGQRFGILDF